MKRKEKIYIEIQGLYDGVATVYDPNSNTFEWRDVAIARTTEQYRNEMEVEFYAQFKEQTDETTGE